MNTFKFIWAHLGIKHFSYLSFKLHKTFLNFHKLAYSLVNKFYSWPRKVSIWNSVFGHYNQNMSEKACQYFEHLWRRLSILRTSNCSVWLRTIPCSVNKQTIYRIVPITNTCYYSENHIFSFFKVSNSNMPQKFLFVKIERFWR